MKDFSDWGDLKSVINQRDDSLIFFREREIWWSSIGLNVGHEQDGKNQNFEWPILILRKFSKNMAWVLPLSSKTNLGIFDYRIHIDNKPYTVLISQIKMMSSKRFLRQVNNISRISNLDFKNIKNLIIAALKDRKPSLFTRDGFLD